MAEDPGDSGYLIAITGIPSVGKSTVSGEVRRHSSTFRLFDGDQFIRNTPGSLQPTNALKTLSLMLDEVERWLMSSNVILDVTLPASFVERTRERFGSSVMFVSLRVEEDEWHRRDSHRTDRGRLRQWDASLTALQGPEDLYDLVIDTTHLTPHGCAERILSKAQDFWESVRL